MDASTDRGRGDHQRGSVLTPRLRACGSDCEEGIVKALPNCAHEQKERKVLDLEGIVADLKKERDRIGRAIAALVDSYSPFAVKKTKAIATQPTRNER